MRSYESDWRTTSLKMRSGSTRAISGTSPVATPLWGGLPGEIERPHPFASPHAGHLIRHHVAGPLSVDPDKAGRRHAPRVLVWDYKIGGFQVLRTPRLWA
jgi:hypothetical protein